MTTVDLDLLDDLGGIAQVEDDKERRRREGWGNEEDEGAEEEAPDCWMRCGETVFVHDGRCSSMAGAAEALDGELLSHLRGSVVWGPTTVPTTRHAIVAVLWVCQTFCCDHGCCWFIH